MHSLQIIKKEIRDCIGQYIKIISQDDIIPKKLDFYLFSYCDALMNDYAIPPNQISMLHDSINAYIERKGMAKSDIKLEINSDFSDQDIEIKLILEHDGMIGVSSFFTSKSNQKIYSEPTSKRFSVGSITYTPFDLNKKDDIQSICFHMVETCVSSLASPSDLVKPSVPRHKI